MKYASLSRVAAKTWIGVRGVIGGFVLVATVFVAFCTALTIAYRWIEPPITGVQAQRCIEALTAGRRCGHAYVPLPMDRISPHLAHAVVAAEDSRFFDHHGFDWDEIGAAIDEGSGRGASTISQQLAKNLFLTTHRSYLRKAIEVPLTWLVELVLSKRRILELYLNVVEWDEGVYGAESAAEDYFGTQADHLSRRQSAALASCLPDPRRRHPRLDGRYTQMILKRMEQAGH